jgi:hypothetical protein
VRAQRLPFAGGCGFEFPIRDGLQNNFAKTPADNAQNYFAN